MDTSNFSSSPHGEESPAPNPENQPPVPEQPVNGSAEGQVRDRNIRSNNSTNNNRNRRGHFRHKRQGQRRNEGQGQGQSQGQTRSARGHGQGNNRRGAAFSGPMDHSYRQNGQNQNDSAGNNVQGNNRNQRFGRRGGRFRPQFGRNRNMGSRPQQPFAPQSFQQAIEPVPYREDAETRIFAFIEDLFFMTKIMDTAKKLNVKVEFVKSYDELIEKVGAEENVKPSLVIFDLNNVNAKPLATIAKLKAKFKKATSVLGFLSHVQGDLKLKAQEAGCDSVMPRSAFSQNLPQLLRRHGAPEDLEQGE